MGSEIKFLPEKVICNMFICNFSKYYLKASEPKWVNPDDFLYRINSLKLGSLHILSILSYIIKMRRKREKHPVVFTFYLILIYHLFFGYYLFIVISYLTLILVFVIDVRKWHLFFFIMLKYFNIMINDNINNE